MEIEPILKEFKQRMAELYGRRLKKVMFYGSDFSISEDNARCAFESAREFAEHLAEWLKSDLSDD